MNQEALEYFLKQYTANAEDEHGNLNILVDRVTEPFETFESTSFKIIGDSLILQDPDADMLVIFNLSDIILIQEI